MKRSFWFPATALSVACWMAVIGVVPRGAAAEVAVAGQPARYAAAARGDSHEIRPAEGGGVESARKAHVRVPTWVLVVVAIIVSILWLIYRSFAGWRPMIW